MNKIWQKLPVSWALTGVFLIFSVVVILISIRVIDNQREHFISDKEEELKTIAELKVGQISQWRHERKGDAIIIRDNLSLINQIGDFLNKSYNINEKTALLRWMNSIINNYDYFSLAITDSKGVVRLSVPASDSTVGPVLKPVIQTVLTEKKIVLSDLHRVPPDNFVHIDLVIPVLKISSADSSAIGLIILRIDPKIILYPLVQTWPTQSRTSETLLLRRDGDSVVYLNQLKHLPNAPLSIKRAISDSAFIGTKAVKGFEGIAEGTDYRNIPVLAAIKKIPESSWYMVSKVDIEEINSLFADQRNLLRLLIIFFISAFGAVIGWTIWQQRARFYRQKYEVEVQRLALRKHFDYILKYANDIVLLMDSDLRIIEVNDRAVEVYQYSREELISMSITVLRLPELLSELDEKLKILNDIGYTTYETVHRRKDGTTFKVEVSARRFEIEGIKYYQSIGRDITERKRIEENLNQLLERYNLATQAAGLAVWEWDILNDHLIWDDKVYELYGTKKKELPPFYDSWLKILHPDDREKANSEIEKAIMDESEYSTEFRIIRPDGSIRYLKAFGQVVRGKDDSSLSMIGINYDITEQKTAENLLKEREFLLSESQRVGKLGSYIFDIESLMWTSSEVLDEVFGIDKHFERTLESWNNIVHPEEREEMLDYLNMHVIEEKNNFDKEYRIIHFRSGEERWVHGRGELSFTADGRVAKMFGTIQDITERKLAERSIIESEERMRKIFDESPLSIAMSDPDFKFIRVNSAFCRMMGYNENEILQMTFRDLTHPDYITRDEESLRQLVERKIPVYKVEKRYIRKDKSVIWGSANINTIFNGAGQVKYLLAMIEDITLRKKSEFELEKSLSILKATIESTADGILVVDTNGKIVQYNRKFTEMWRIPLDILYKQDDRLALEFVQEQLTDPASFVTNVQRLYSSPEMVTNDVLQFKDGRVFERYSQPQKINNLTVGRVWSFRDITQKKIAESQLVSAKEKAEQSDRLKTAFLHNISHEIRTPMNAIVGFTALLDEPDLNAEKRKQFINIISQSTNQLLSIISDIVDISNIETNQVKLTLTQVNINSVINSLFTQYKPAADQQNLLFHYLTGLTDEQAVITTDKTKIIQIISNLLNNAFKFTHQGTVQFGYRISGENLEFFVKDTGIGVSADKQARIFDRFFQVENKYSRQYTGAGLGLSICKAYVELLGGRIGLKSKPDKGSEFWFTLPYKV